MITLIFNHQNYTVMTSAWSACDRDEKTRIVYLWGADRVSIFGIDAGTAALTIPIPMGRFIEVVVGNDLVDLRRYQ